MSGTKAVLYWFLTFVSVGLGTLVVLPFYAYRIPSDLAGAAQQYDVKNYWPFGFSGFAYDLHMVVLFGAFVAPLVFLGVIIWSAVMAKTAVRRRSLFLANAALNAALALAMAVNVSAILAWHVD